MECIIPYIGDKQFRFVAAVNHTFYKVYTEMFPCKRTSFHISNVQSFERVIIHLDENHRGSFRSIFAGFQRISPATTLKTHVIRLVVKEIEHSGSMENFRSMRQRHPGLLIYETDITAYAASHGLLNLLQLLHKSGCRLNDDLKYAHENGCRWNEYTCSKAAENGHLKIIQYARSHGCPWTAHTVRNAIAKGHSVVAEWAIAHGCPRNVRSTFRHDRDDDDDYYDDYSGDDYGGDEYDDDYSYGS